MSNKYRLQSEAQQHLGCFPRRGETYRWSSLCGQDQVAGREPPWGGVGLLRKGGVCTEGGYGEVVPSCSLELGGAEGEHHYRAVAGTEKE